MRGCNLLFEGDEETPLLSATDNLYFSGSRDKQNERANNLHHRARKSLTA